MLRSPGMPVATVAALEGIFQALGFESLGQREAPVQGFLEELARFQEQLDAHGGPIGCALVAVVAPRGQLRWSQKLAWEMSRCRALQGCPKLFLLLSSSPGGEWAG
ncbi:caspase-14-like [Loxodonta africana]|uniref:caspase-14-like n=1 Tax=Loxodonta africana TaxID=9785 RepID=UPI0030D26506